MHAIYHHYYECLQIIQERLKQDYNDYDLGLDHAARIFKMKDKSKRNSELLLNSEGLSTIGKSIQLDSESYILFVRILLDKVGLLVELVLNNPNKYSLHQSFTKHKEYFIKNRQYNSKYSKLLEEMYWYDQYLLLIRDKVVQHGRVRHAWLKPDEKPVHLLMGENFGLLSDKRKAELVTIVEKYAPRYVPEIKDLNLPLSEISVVMDKVLNDSARMEDGDLKKLQAIVQLTGAAVYVPELAKKLDQFLKGIALIFKE
jgi:hypothetical protein